MIHVVMIGCGGFARRYHVPALLADPAVKIAAIFDPLPTDAVREIASRAGAALVASMDALPDPPSPTLAIVTTPHALHAAHVAAALARGWHVLCDKPFVSHAEEARALAAEARRRGLLNAVAFNRRYDRGCRRAREAIRAGTIGPVRFVQTTQLGYERAGWFLDPALGGGGPFTGRASHMADLVPWLLDRVPTRLRSRVRPGPPGRTDHGGFIELLFGDLECHLTCIEEGWHGWDDVRIFGEDGAIELHRPLKLPLGWSCRITTRHGDAAERLEAEPVQGAATRDMLAAMRGGVAAACDFDGAVTSVAVVEAAFASARDGGWREVGV
jgi:predicted dehydrogenase